MNTALKNLAVKSSPPSECRVQAMATKEVIKLNLGADTRKDIAAATQTLTRKQNRKARTSRTEERKPDRLRFTSPNSGSRAKANYGPEGQQFFCPVCHKTGLVP